MRILSLAVARTHGKKEEIGGNSGGFCCREKKNKKTACIMAVWHLEYGVQKKKEKQIASFELEAIFSLNNT